MDHLLHVNKGLERQLISLRNDKDSSIKESTTDNIPLVEISQMKQKYEKDVSLIKTNSNNTCTCIHVLYMVYFK